MKDRYKKAYNVKIYTKPKWPLYYKYYNIKRKVYFIHYFTNPKFSFKEGDYVIKKIKTWNGFHCVVYHLTKYKRKNALTIKSCFNNINPSIIEYIYNVSAYSPNKNSYLYNEGNRFLNDGEEWFNIMNLEDSNSKILQVISKTKSSDIKLLLKFYLDEIEGDNIE